MSIGFDLRQLEFTTFKDAFGDSRKPSLLKVEYDIDKQTSELEELFIRVKSVHDAHAPILAENNDALEAFSMLFMPAVRSALHTLRWEFKSPFYAEEREWRLVAMPFGTSRPSFRVSAGRIIPFIEIPLPQTASRPLNRLAVPEIILGPKCQYAVLGGIRNLLQNLAYPEVRTSRLSLR